MIEKRISVLPPPGVKRRGGAYASQGAWYDTNWVRWENGAVVPRAAAGAISSHVFTAVPRAFLPYWDPVNTAYVVLESDATGGSLVEIMLADATTVTRISGTPGGAPWGVGSRLGLSFPVWFGVGTTRYLLFMLPSVDGNATLKQWQAAFPVVADSATAVSGAPLGQAVVVTPERFVMVLGAGGQMQTVQWADQGTLTSWTPLATNQAGDYTLATGGLLVAGRTTRYQTLLWTTEDLWAATYVGPPGIYSFAKVGSNCGLAGGLALGQMGEEFFWQDRHGNFWTYDGTVRPLPADDVRQAVDAILLTVNQADERSTVFADVDHNEVTWFFSQSAEPSFGVTYHRTTGVWSLSHFGLTAVWAGSSPGLAGPVVSDSSSKLLSMFTSVGRSAGNLVLTGAPYAETGPVIGPGDEIVRLQKVIPAIEAPGDLSVTVYTGFTPSGTETTTALGALTQAETDVRLSGRYHRFKFTEAVLTQWHLAGLDVGVLPLGNR